VAQPPVVSCIILSGLGSLEILIFLLLAAAGLKRRFE
jgi:hypothetical protein